MDMTGAGDNPAILKAFHGFARFFDEPAPLEGHINPPKDIGGKPASRRARMYDHPSSAKRTGG